MSAYTLDHASPEAEMERLEWNHKNVCVPYLGGLLPHNIMQFLKAERQDNRSLAVAEMATGTGIWLVDLAGELPGNARLDGYDLVASKFRPTSLLPENVYLQQANAMDPFPSELHGVYDVVHVRFMMLSLLDDEWEPLARNLFTLLHPGGWLVWQEGNLETYGGDPTEMNVQYKKQNETDKAAQSSSTESALIVPSLTSDIRAFHRERGHGNGYPVGIETMLQAVGFVDTAQEVHRYADNWDSPEAFAKTQWMGYTIAETCCHGILSVGGYGQITTQEDTMRLLGLAREEIMSGAVEMNFTVWRTVARKPLGNALASL